jgi:hypothetical protein
MGAESNPPKLDKQEHPPKLDPETVAAIEREAREWRAYVEARASAMDLTPVEDASIRIR